jgi:hypothetical protein
VLVSITDLLVRASVLTETTPTPVTPDEDLVTPGIVGFIATFFVAVVTVLLILDMVRRVRRVNYRDQVREKLLLEQAELDLAAPDAPTTDAAAAADAPAAPKATPPAQTPPPTE